MRALLRRAGIEITRSPAPHTMAWNLRQLFKHRAIDVVVDVGAHHGEFAAEVRANGHRGRIVSFEPSRSSYAVLTARMASDAAWEGRQEAVGARVGELTLNTYPGSDFNSALAPTGFGRERFGMAVTGSETVPVVRLDGVIGGGSVLLKTDTQGYDLEVLAGASGIMDRTVAVLIELSVQPIYIGAPTMPEIVARLCDNGFAPHAFVPVSRSQGFGVIEFDGLFVRP